MTLILLNEHIFFRFLEKSSLERHCIGDKIVESLIKAKSHTIIKVLVKALVSSKMYVAQRRAQMLANRARITLYKVT